MVIHPGAVRGGAISALLTALIGGAVTLAAWGAFDLSRGARTGLFTVFAIAAFLLGGFRAGLLYPPAPLGNGGLAALFAYVPMFVVRLVQGGGVVGGLFAAFLAAALGVFGGMVSNSANRQRANRQRTGS